MTGIEQSNNFYMDKEHPFDSFEDVRIQTTEKEEQLLSSLSPQDKDRCVKTIIRLFLFKCRSFPTLQVMNSMTNSWCLYRQ